MLSLASILVGCTDGPSTQSSDEGGGSEGTGVVDSTSSLSGSGAVQMSTGAVSTTAVDTGDMTTDTTMGAGFIYGGGADSPPPFSCDIFEQDCDEGEKCMPWANDGGGSWNATRCSPIAENPGQPGDSCTVEGSPVSGVDDCDLGVMCWDSDVETNMGTCVAMCMGTPDNPQCADPDNACAITNDGAIALCLPACDPVLQDCDEGQGCYAVDDEFVCANDSSGAMGTYGDGCGFLNACDPGLLCLPAASVPSCVGSSGCCSEVCDITDPAGNDQCTGVLDGQECTPWFEMGEGPPEFDTVGVCALPE